MGLFTREDERRSEASHRKRNSTWGHKSMKDVAEVIDRLTEHLGTLLRYVGAGFAALIIFAVIVPSQREMILQGTPMVIVTGALIGVTLYSFHKALMLDLIQRLIPRVSRWWQGRDREFPFMVVLGVFVGVLCGLVGPVVGGVLGVLLIGLSGGFQDLVFGDQPTLEDMHWSVEELDRQRWLRRASTFEEAKNVQSEMDRWGSMLNFQYCLSYAMMGVPQFVPHCTTTASYSKGIAAAGFLLFVVALWSENKIRQREIAISKWYPDGNKLVKKYSLE